MRDLAGLRHSARPGPQGRDTVVQAIRTRQNARRLRVRSATLRAWAERARGNSPASSSNQTSARAPPAS
jgi:hypothetical protein